MPLSGRMSYILLLFLMLVVVALIGVNGMFLMHQNQSKDEVEALKSSIRALTGQITIVSERQREELDHKRTLLRIEITFLEGKRAIAEQAGVSAARSVYDITMASIRSRANSVPVELSLAEQQLAETALQGALDKPRRIDIEIREIEKEIRQLDLFLAGIGGP